MSKGFKVVAGVLAAFVGISLMHAWLNIGFERFGFGAAGEDAATFRVGFLPVT
jgi:hypothetical protein